MAAQGRVYVDFVWIWASFWGPLRSTLGSIWAPESPNGALLSIFVVLFLRIRFRCFFEGVQNQDFDTPLQPFAWFRWGIGTPKGLHFGSILGAKSSTMLAL